MRKTFIRIITCIMVVMAWSGCKNGDKLPYQNESLSIEKRVDDLLDRLTVNEKIDLMRATSPANERLGFPKYYHGNEAFFWTSSEAKRSIYHGTAMYGLKLYSTGDDAVLDVFDRFYGFSVRCIKE